MSNSIKRIKGIEYLYCTYYIEGKRHDVYCGPAKNPDSKRRALEVEIEHARKQYSRFAQKTKELEMQLNNMA